MTSADRAPSSCNARLSTEKGQGLDKHNHITKNMVMNKDYTKAIPAAWQNVSRVFTALGDEHRQRILLTFEPGERLNVGQIVEVSTLSRSAVSHHLRILRDAGVLDSEKIGKEVYFWLNKKQVKEALLAVIDYLKAQ
jgi:DNA-binding transcriptional ArsR family regulator